MGDLRNGLSQIDCRFFNHASSRAQVEKAGEIPINQVIQSMCFLEKPQYPILPEEKRPLLLQGEKTGPGLFELI